MKHRRAARRFRWLRLAILVLLLAAAIMAVPRARTATLRTLGHALVIDDRVTSADVIVISVDASSAGVLEAADLVRNGVSKAVAVFAEVPGSAELELNRRGIPHPDRASRAVQQLELLGVTNPMRIPTPVDGTTAEARVLSSWVGEHGFRTVVMITTADHTRRTRRVLRRAFAGQNTHVVVHAARHSEFKADTWWHTRTGIRTGITEAQKLLLDILAHPLS